MLRSTSINRLCCRRIVPPLTRHLTCPPDNRYKPVYKFPYIEQVGLINRLKVYQTALTVLTLPTSMVLSELNYFTHDDVLFTAIMGLAGLIPLYSVGFVTNKLVGIVYINDTKETTKLAYLDFWGRRNNVEIPIKDVVPFSDLSHRWTDGAYLRVNRYSNKETYKLCTKYGVLDKISLNKIFSC